MNGWMNEQSYDDLQNSPLSYFPYPMINRFLPISFWISFFFCLKWETLSILYFNVSNEERKSWKLLGEKEDIWCHHDKWEY